MANPGIGKMLSENTIHGVNMTEGRIHCASLAKSPYPFLQLTFNCGKSTSLIGK